MRIKTHKKLAQGVLEDYCKTLKWTDDDLSWDKMVPIIRAALDAAYARGVKAGVEARHKEGA